MKNVPQVLALWCRRLCRAAISFPIVPLLALAWVMPLAAQTNQGAIEGRVLNPASGNYLKNVRVAVEGSGLFTFTDDVGRYSLSVPSGAVIVTVNYPGVAAQKATLDVPAGSVIEKNFELGAVESERVVTLEKFTVVANREMDANAVAVAEQRHSPNIKNVIAADAFGDVSEGNVGEFLKLIPGVTVNNAAGDASTISLRGMPSGYTPITIDGNQVASGSSSNSSRTIDLEQMSINNVSRVEVMKTPVPSMWAASLGGSINLVGKSAFERANAQVILRALAQFSADTLTLDKTPGPGPGQTRKVRPAFDFSYVKPVSSNFGFTLSARHSNQFGRDRNAIAGWEYLPANGGTEAAPFFRTVQIRDDSRETVRDTYGMTADWRPFKSLTLSFAAQHNVYDLRTQPTRILFDAAVRPASYDENTTVSRAGAASVTHQPLWWDKFGATDNYSFAAKYKEGDWKIDLNLALSDSDNHYRDTERGFFRTVGTRIVSPTLSLDGISGPERPESIVVRNTLGAEVDWRRLSNYQIQTATSDVRDGTDKVTTARLDVRRDIRLSGVTLAAQGGLAVQVQKRDRRTPSYRYNFVGADHVAATADDGAGVILDQNYVGQDPKFGWEKNIEWPDMQKLYQLYQAHPDYFVLDESNLLITGRNGSEAVQETLSAAYLQLEARFWQDKVRVVGGARFEKTKDEGIGLLRDQGAWYQKDANGNFVRDSNGNRIPITNNALERLKLEYIERGARTENSYDDIYPSLNASIEPVPNLIVRLGYALTIGRPDYSNIIPNTDIAENSTGTTGVIRVRNITLQPWTADNYDLSAEYYFKSAGVVSVGVFRKDIVNAFQSVTTPADAALLAELNLDSDYLGWSVVTMFNRPGTMRVEGLELNYRQGLSELLPSWGKGLTIFANATLLKLSAPIASFPELKDKSINWGVSYSRGRVGVNLNWRYVGEQVTSLATFATDAVNYSPNKTSMDLNLEYRFTPKVSAFFNARDFHSTNIPSGAYSPNSPDYSRATTQGLTVAKCSLGIKAIF